MTKKILSICVAFSLITGSMALPTFGQAILQTNPNMISVSGHGRVMVKPDVIRFDIGCEAHHKVATVAQKESRTKMIAIIKALKSQGVKDADIQRTVEDTSINKGNYETLNKVVVTFRDFTRIDSSVGAAVKAGANFFGTVSSAVENQEKYQIQATALALKNAEEQAKEIALFSNTTIINPSKINIKSYELDFNFNSTLDSVETAKMLKVAQIGTFGFSADVEMEYPVTSSQNKPRIFAVTCRTEMGEKIDKAYLEIGYEAQNKVAAVAQKEARTKMFEVIKALKAQGVKDEDIEMLNVYMVKASNAKAVKKDYFIAHNTVKITCKDLTRLNSIVDTAVKSGANEFTNIKFASDSYFGKSKQDANLLTLGLKNAKIKAQNIASINGVTINNPSKISVERGKLGSANHVSNIPAYLLKTIKKFEEVENTTNSDKLVIEVGIEYQY